MLSIISSEYEIPKCHARDDVLINRLERRFGRYAVPNVTLILIIGQVMMLVVGNTRPAGLANLQLIPERVLDGEVHRLVTFMFMPPGTSPLWAFFFWYIFYLMGTALEGYWGTFRYNVFLLIGYVATVAAAFVTPDTSASNWFLQGTVFLAFAYLNPYFELRLMFILPIQIRWLAFLTWIGFLFAFLGGSWSTRLSIAASVVNFILFFGSDLLARAKSGRRRVARRAQRVGKRPDDFFHKCEVCGITDVSHPQMDFRYCSQCSGTRGYCTEHIRDHEHV